MRDGEECLTLQEQKGRRLQEFRHKVTDNRYRAAETLVALWWLDYWSEDIIPYNRLILCLLLLLLLRSYNQTNNGHRQTYREDIKELNLRFEAAARFRDYAAQDNLPKVEECIEVFGNNDLNPTDPVTGIAPLHSAVKGMSLRTAKLLKDSGADINLQDLQGNTPVHLAIMNILQIGADVTKAAQLGSREKAMTELLKRNTPVYKILLGIFTHNKTTNSAQLDSYDITSTRSAIAELAKVEPKPAGYEILTTLLRAERVDLRHLIIAAKTTMSLQLAQDKAAAYNVLLELLSSRKDPRIKAALDKLKASTPAPQSSPSNATSPFTPEFFKMARQVKEMDINLKINPMLKNAKQETLLDLLDKVGDQTCEEFKIVYSKVRQLAEKAHQESMSAPSP